MTGDITKRLATLSGKTKSVTSPLEEDLKSLSFTTRYTKTFPDHTDDLAHLFIVQVSFDHADKLLVFLKNKDYIDFVEIEAPRHLVW